MKSKKKPLWVWIVFVAALGILGWRVTAFMQGLDEFKANTDQIVKDQEHALQTIDSRIEKKNQEIDALKTKAASHSVEYKVSGTAKTANVTYADSKENTSQIAGATLPWSLSFTGKTGNAAMVIAQNADSSGDIVCKIFIDGKEVNSNSSSGAGVIAEVHSKIE